MAYLILVGYICYIYIKQSGSTNTHSGCGGGSGRRYPSRYTEQQVGTNEQSAISFQNPRVEAAVPAVAEDEQAPISDLSIADSLRGPGWYRLTYIDYDGRTLTRVHRVWDICPARKLARYGTQNEIIVATTDQWIALERIKAVELLALAVQRTEKTAASAPEVGADEPR